MEILVVGNNTITRSGCGFVNKLVSWLPVAVLAGE